MEDHTHRAQPGYGEPTNPAVLAQAQAQAESAAAEARARATAHVQAATVAAQILANSNHNNQVRKPSSVAPQPSQNVPKCKPIQQNIDKWFNKSSVSSKPPPAKRKRPRDADTDSNSDLSPSLSNDNDINLDLARLVYRSTSDQLNLIDQSLSTTTNRLDTWQLLPTVSRSLPSIVRHTDTNSLSALCLSPDQPTVRRTHSLLSDISQPRPLSLLSDISQPRPLSLSHNFQTMFNNHTMHATPCPTAGTSSSPGSLPVPASDLSEVSSRTTTQVTKTKSVSFQIDQQNQGTLPLNNAPPRVPVPPGADETWRLTRKHLSAAVKATVRADHLTQLVNQSLTPSWTIGAEALPGYIKPLITALATHRQSQATHTLNFLAEELRLAAQVSRNLGNAQQMVLERLYDTNQADYNASVARINELVLRDETDCRTSLQRRLATLQANPVSTTDTQNFLLGQHMVYSNTRPTQQAAANPRSAAAEPVAGPSNVNLPVSRAGSSTTQQSYRARSPTSRSRGNYRGRGTPRGGPSRGRGSSTQGRGRRQRSRSNSRSRNSTRGPVKSNNMTPDELRVLQAYRESKQQ